MLQLKYLELCQARRAALTWIWSIWLESREIVVKHKSAVIIGIDLQTHRDADVNGGFPRGVEHLGGRCSSTRLHSLFSPVRWLACSRDTAGCWAHTWVSAAPGAFLPGRPRVSSFGGPTPRPKCPSGGCNAGAGVLHQGILVYKAACFNLHIFSIYMLQLSIRIGQNSYKVGIVTFKAIIFDICPFPTRQVNISPVLLKTRLLGTLGTVRPIYLTGIV